MQATHTAKKRGIFLQETASRDHAVFVSFSRPSRTLLERFIHQNITMKITKTTDPQSKPSVVMLVYGMGGVGKTTFAATAPKPLIVDCENGAKYFGLRGIDVDVAKIGTWEDLGGIFDVAKSGEYQTIVLDPIGELMEKLKRYMVAKGGKNLQADGSPTMAGWGWLKDTMRSTIKILRDSGLNLILVAHVTEQEDDQRIVKRPMLMTKLSEELINMVDIVGYMTVVQDEGVEKRIIMVDPSSDKYEAKDRTGQLGKVIPPDFSLIIKAVHGSEKFAWSADDAKTAPVKPQGEEAPVAPAGRSKSSVASKARKAAKKTA